MNIAGAIEYLSAGLSPVTDEHLTEARLAVSDMAEIPYNRLNKYKASTFPAALMPRLEELVSRRKSGEPLQYILGKWEFMGLPFYTRPCALIPRQDTETLCEEALSIGGKTLLDLCCGTGCIGVSLAKLGGFEVTFGDISPDCLALARENAALNGLSDRVEFLCADVFALLPELEAKGQKFDLVILDPPAFTKSRASVKKAVTGYREINLRAMKLIRDGGFLATCSCSHFVDYALFTQTIGQAARNVHKRLRQVEYRTQAPDHPILWDAEDSYYLKFYIFQVCDEK